MAPLVLAESDWTLAPNIVIEEAETAKFPATMLAPALVKEFTARLEPALTITLPTPASIPDRLVAAICPLLLFDMLLKANAVALLNGEALKNMSFPKLRADSPEVAIDNGVADVPMVPPSDVREMADALIDVPVP